MHGPLKRNPTGAGRGEGPGSVPTSHLGEVHSRRLVTRTSINIEVDS